jgi:hypothetical protein
MKMNKINITFSVRDEVIFKRTEENACVVFLLFICIRNKLISRFREEMYNYLPSARASITGILACCRRNIGIPAMREDAIPGGNLV